LHFVFPSRLFLMNPHYFPTRRSSDLHIAIERIANECEKLFASPFVEKGITYLIETKTYEHLPILKDHPDIVSKLKQMIQPLHYLDRKSTRLNSSHVSMSYAVFCLK